MRFFLGFSAAFGLILCGCTPTDVAQSGTSSSVVTEGGEAAAGTPGVSGDITADPEPTAEGGSGLSPADSVNATTESASEPAPAAGEPPAATESTAGSDAAKLTPVKIEEGVLALSPDNTKIQFTGTHSPPKAPDPRVGGFAKFSGEAKVDAEAKKLESVSVDIDTTSLFTTIPNPAMNEKLANHLRTADFFDVREYPTAKFESTEIAPDDDGLVTIKGNLTLHGETKEISIPAAVSITEEGLTLKSEFSINRSEFGMTFGEGQVDDKVSLSVAIGEKTETP